MNNINSIGERIKPSFDVLVRLAKQYSVDMNWLITNQEDGLHSGLQDDELALLKNYRNLQSIAKEELLEYLNLRL
ncbi:MAG: hypothetical protein WD469_07650 [Paenibacillaceae bacterium]